MNKNTITLKKLREILLSRGMYVTRQTICTHAKKGMIPTARKVGREYILDEDKSIKCIQHFKKWVGSSGAHQKKPIAWQYDPSTGKQKPIYHLKPVSRWNFE
jgi:hypothetical protein